MADLFDYFAALTGAGPTSYAEFPGFKLKTPANGAFTRKPPVRCLGCANLDAEGKHEKAFEDVYIGPSGDEALWSAALTTHSETVREYVEKARALTHFLHLQANGVLQADALPINFVTPSSTFSWELVSVSGNTVTAKWTTGDTDPRAVSYSTIAINPSFGAPGETRWTSTENFTALRPGGILSFSAPSQLVNHAGVIVTSVNVTTPPGTAMANPSTFTFTVMGNVSGAAAKKWPVDDSGTIKIDYRHYYTYAEPWHRMRRDSPLYCVKQRITLSAPIAGVNTVVEKASRFAEADWFDAEWVKDGNNEDKTSAFIPLTHVRHIGDTDYRTILDLTGEDLDGVTSITLTLWVESAEDAARNCAQDRCGNSIPDFSKSWGILEGNAKWHCAFQDTASLASTFRPKCIQTECDQWLPQDAPTNPMNRTIMQQLHGGIPWQVVQIPSMPDAYLSRLDAPGMRALVTQPALPGGYHVLVNMAFAAGGWYTRAQISGFQEAHYGYEWNERKDGGAVWVNPDYSDTGTWPDKGVAGGNFTHEPGLPLNATDNLGSDDDDPAHNRQAACMMGSQLVRQYSMPGNEYFTLEWFGEHVLNSYIPTAAKRLELWFPDLLVDATVETYADGTFQSGFFTEQGKTQATENLGEETVYYWKLTLDPRRPSPMKGTLNKTSAKIKVMTGPVSNVYSFWFENGVESGARQADGGVQADIKTFWKQGGNIAALPDWAEVQNYTSTRAYRGVRRGVQNGDTCKFSASGGFVKGAVKDRRFWVNAAKACADADNTESYVPTAWTEEHSYLAHGRIFLQFQSPYDADEFVKSGMTVKRNSETVTLTELANNEEVRPYYFDVVPSVTGKDEYYWEYVDDGTTLRGILLFFSKNQHTATATDFADIEVVFATENGDDPPADQHSYQFDFSLWTGLPQALVDTWGIADPDNLLKKVITSHNGDDIDSVVSVTARRRDGKVTTLTKRTDSPVYPATFDQWNTNEYHESAIVGDSVTITVTPDLSEDVITVKLEMGTNAQNTSDYYDAHVLPLAERVRSGPFANGSLPNNHKVWAHRQDRVDVYDEAGMIAAAIAEGETFIDSVVNPRTVHFENEGVMHWRDLEVHKASYDVVGDDSNITGSCLVLGAQGEIYGPVLAARDCLRIRGRGSDYNGMPKLAEIHGLRTILERIIGT